MVMNYTAANINRLVPQPEPMLVGFYRLAAFTGTVLLLVGLAYYAKAKDRSAAWCLFAFLGIIGIIILACLKDKTTTAVDLAATAESSTGLETSGLAISSLVLGVLAFFTLGLTSIPGLVTGILGLEKIHSNAAILKGRGLAIAGIILSGAAIVLFILIFSL